MWNQNWSKNIQYYGAIKIYQLYHKKLKLTLDQCNHKFCMKYVNVCPLKLDDCQPKNSKIVDLVKWWKYRYEMKSERIKQCNKVDILMVGNFQV